MTTTRTPYPIRSVRGLLLAGALLLLLAPLARADVAEAQAARWRGEDMKALDLLRDVLGERPSDPEALALLQDLLHDDGRDDSDLHLDASVPEPVRRWLAVRRAREPGSAKGFEDLLEEEGIPAIAARDLARMQMAEGEARDAERTLEAYLRRVPDDAHAWALLGDAHLAQGDLRKATDAFEKGVEAHPGHPLAAAGLAKAQRRDGEAKAARETITQALAVHPKSVHLLTALGRDQVLAGEPAEGEATLSRLLPAERFPDVHAWLAMAHRRQRRVAEATAAAVKALSLDEDHLVALETKGWTLQKAGAYAEALEIFNRVLEMAPEWPRAYASAGFTYLLMGDMDYAEKLLEKGYRLDREDLEINLALGVYHYVDGKSRSARKHLDDVLEIDPENVTALRTMGYVHLDDGKASKAMDVLEQARALEPEDAKTVRVIGRALLELGKQEEAIATFREAIALDGEDGWAHFDLGKALELTGDFEGAAASYAEAIDKAPTMPWVRLYYAELLDDIQGDLEAALEQYEKFLELGGEDIDNRVEQRIEQIYNLFR